MERARLELAASSKAAEEGKAGAVQEREEVQVALEASIQAGDLMRSERDAATSRAEDAGMQLEAAKSQLEVGVNLGESFFFPCFVMVARLLARRLIMVFIFAGGQLHGDHARED